MIASVLAALALAPWSQPLAFGHLTGWDTGRSGNTQSLYGGRGSQLESTAWIARGVRYRDDPTADPPNKTLEHLPRGAVIVWAVIYDSAASTEATLRLSLAGAKQFACCEAVPVVGGEWELSGAGPGRSYSVIVRIYYGAKPTRTTRAEAQSALRHLDLPPPH